MIMRNRRAVLFLGLAAFSGLATAFVARQAAEQRPLGMPVVVASQIATIGQAAELAQLRVVSWPHDEALPQGAFTDIGLLAGRVLARSVVPGEPVLESSLLPQGSEAGLGALIGESSRAVSVQVDEFVGVAGFVQPGSKVDVLATISNGGGASRSEAVLQNVRVLAVDVRTAGGDGTPQAARVVTLEVSPRQAESLVQAEASGKIKLAMRNPKDESHSRPIQMVLGTDVHDVRF
jgi:pilus assembly protein CpaB